MLNYLRDSRRRRFLPFEPGTRTVECGDVACEWADVVHVLELRLTESERQTLAMLRLGVLSNAAIARVRGVTEREAQCVRAALAAKAARLWKNTPPN